MIEGDDVRSAIDTVYRSESRRVLATLIRLLGDFDLAEEALHDAFAAAMEKWPQEGIPQNPRTWLISTGRFKTIDKLRRRTRLEAKIASDAERVSVVPPFDEAEEDAIGDDRLRLIFTCCHPALSPDARIALTLREICGLTTEQVARAFLTPAPTLAQRIVRAKNKIRASRIPYEIPARAELPERLDSVLHVIYLVFNEGYAATSGDSLRRPDLTAEAIALARLVVELLDDDSEATGLLALMLLHESRGASRTTPAGEIVLLDEQDRSLWHRGLIEEGLALVERALGSRRYGSYTLQAAIAAVHANAPDSASTDWDEIVGLYAVLLRAEPSPVVELNRAAAIAMRDGPERGLALIDELLGRGELSEYHLAFAAKADLLRRLGRSSEAIDSYRRALELVSQEPERRFIESRLAALEGTA